MILYIARDIPAFVLYCVYGESCSFLLIESTDSMIYTLVGCKHQASEGLFYIGGRDCVLCHFIEPVTFACCSFIFVLRNIVLDGYYTGRNI